MEILIKFWKEIQPGDLVMMSNTRAWMVLSIRPSLTKNCFEVEIQWITLWHDSQPTGLLSRSRYWNQIPDHFIVLRP